MIDVINIYPLADELVKDLYDFLSADYENNKNRFTSIIINYNFFIIFFNKI